MTDAATREAVSSLGRALGADLVVDGRSLRLGADEVSLPTDVVPRGPRRGRPEWEGSLLNMRHALPSRAHGDQREKLLYMLIQDASPAGRPTIGDNEFRDELSSLLPMHSAVERDVVAAAIRDEYWVTPKDRAFLVPYHSSLPISFKLSARYKLFRGVILPFLCWDGSDIRVELLADFFDLFNGKEGFTLLDDLLLRAADQKVELDGVRADADALLDRDDADTGVETREAVEQAFAEGAFCQPSLDLFQRDLRTVLSLQDKVPRRDLIDMVTALLSLHLAVYYYRVALVLGQEVDRLIAASAGHPDPFPGCDCAAGLSGCPLADAIRFRVGTRGDKPVRLRDECAVAYRELDTGRLLPLSVTLITLNLAQRIWHGLGGPGGKPRPRELAVALRSNSQFRERFDVFASGVAAVHAVETADEPDPLEAAEYASNGPGLFALRESVMASGRKKLKYLSRDVVNQLAKRETGGSLIRTRGRVTFFELDEDFLFLLVKLVCRDRGEVALTDFLRGMRSYGLVPQNRAEEVELTNALERLGMLRRYSDAGESMYVKHPL